MKKMRRCNDAIAAKSAEKAATTTRDSGLVLGIIRDGGESLPVGRLAFKARKGR
jgi:hypothetical protein